VIKGFSLPSKLRIYPVWGQFYQEQIVLPLLGTFMANELTEDEKNKYASYSKLAWAAYTLLCIVVIALLVLFKATDNEERIFFALMGSAALYVFRPSEKFMDKRIRRLMKLPEEK
jgi:hypothetical protein